MIFSYRRVSTEEQHNGPQAQTDCVSRWAEGRGVQIDEDFCDIGVSGSIPLAERPRGGEMCSRIAGALRADSGLTARNVGGSGSAESPMVIASKLDRLFRSVADAAQTLSSWRETGVVLVSVAEGFDMSSPYGRAMAQMASVFAELEREMIRSRTSDALSAMRRRGECIGGLPYGWILAADGNHTIPCQREQEQITWMKSMRSQGWTYEAIGRSLNDNGIPTKLAGGTWRSTQVRRILNRSLS